MNQSEYGSFIERSTVSIHIWVIKARACPGGAMANHYSAVRVPFSLGKVPKEAIVSIGRSPSQEGNVMSLKKHRNPKQLPPRRVP